MIPKVIHYCWFGGNPLPDKAVECINSWKKYMPEYEIKQWDETNFNVNIIPYTTEAYDAKKYAFVSDYARFWILYNYGGVYFDTDVEMIKPIDDIIGRGAFLGCETDSIRLGGSMPGVAPGLGMGSPKGHELLMDFLKLYQSLHFITADGINQKTVDQYTTELLMNYGLKLTESIQLVADTYIYPGEYFGPVSVVSKRLHVTEHTRTIHHYAASWQSKSTLNSLKSMIRNVLPESFLLFINKLKNK